MIATIQCPLCGGRMKKLELQGRGKALKPCRNGLQYDLYSERTVNKRPRLDTGVFYFFNIHLTVFCIGDTLVSQVKSA